MIVSTSWWQQQETAVVSKVKLYRQTCTRWLSGLKPLPQREKDIFAVYMFNTNKTTSYPKLGTSKPEGWLCFHETASVPIMIAPLPLLPTFLCARFYFSKMGNPLKSIPSLLP